MKKLEIKSRKEAIDLIDKYGKREIFEKEWRRTPEEYFADYGYKEPDIWCSLLADLEIIDQYGYLNE